MPHIPSAWLPLAEVKPDPDLRVFCFAHAGGSAALYRSWLGTGSRVEFYPVQLPGHGNRIGEAPLERMEDILDQLEASLAPLLDRPFALFGHSMGSWIAYAAARRLSTHDGHSARHLFVSGAAPPTAGRGPATADRSPAELVTLLRHLGGTSARLLLNDEVMALVLPVFAADLGLMDRYRDMPAVPLNCPITAMGGRDDPLHRPDQLDAWQGLTKASFDRKTFPGGHFYIESPENGLPRLVEDCVLAAGN